MKSFLRSQYILTIASAILCLTAVGVFFKFYSSMKVREARVIDVRDKLASFEQNKKIYSQEAIEFEAIKERIAELEKNLIKNESIPELLSSLEAMADARGVDFAITLVDTDTKGAVGRLHIDFSADGSFANLKALAQDFLSQTYQVRFTKFSLYSGAVASQTASPAGVAVTQSNASWQLLAGMDIVSF